MTRVRRWRPQQADTVAEEPGKTEQLSVSSEPALNVTEISSIPVVRTRINMFSQFCLEIVVVTDGK